MEKSTLHAMHPVEVILLQPQAHCNISFMAFSE